MNNGELTDKQRRFAEEYVQCLNATKAAKRADYSEATAYSIGYENLRKSAVRQYIRELMEERSMRTQISSDLILEQLAEIAQGGDGLKGADRLKALDMLAKHLGFYEEKPPLLWPMTFVVEEKLKAIVASMPLVGRMVLLSMEKWEYQKVMEWLTANYHKRMHAKITEAVEQGRTGHLEMGTDQASSVNRTASFENELFVELLQEAMEEVLSDASVKKIMARVERKANSKLP